MSKPPSDPDKLNYTPWEFKVKRLLTPFEEFIHRQTTSGMLLMAFTVLALWLANSSFAEAYDHMLHQEIGLHIGDWSLMMSMHHWINDGLMTVFFFVVGLELKRELLVGELSDMRQAALPVLAAMGGMLVPASLYLLFNHDGIAQNGWGIPMATDIAFAVGILVLLASRVPKALITFLVALAIADDLGAVLVIALFYTQQISLNWLLIGAALVVTLITLNFSGIRSATPYFLIGCVLWYALLQSGVHATLAGVILAFCVPARSKYNPSGFAKHIREQLTRFEQAQLTQNNIMTNEPLFTVTQEMDEAVRGVQTPLQRLESALHLPVAYLVIPIFALFNAGIPFRLADIGSTLHHPVTLGVMFGLALGKFIGIAGVSWLAIRLGIGQLPSGTRISQVFAVAVLGGIGFTMSIFIAELGFAEHPDLLIMAKTGILMASILSALVGLAWLAYLGRPANR